MDLTFVDRRKKIVNDLAKINVVIEKYPLLCIEEEVLILKFNLLLSEEYLNVLQKI